MSNETKTLTKSDVQVGTQIAYVPQHAFGKLDHPDVQYGFVTAVADTFAFCRYWRRGHENDAVPVQERLRTAANSEGTPYDCLVLHRTVDDIEVKEALAWIEATRYA